MNKLNFRARLDSNSHRAEILLTEKGLLLINAPTNIRFYPNPNYEKVLFGLQEIWKDSSVGIISISSNL